MLDPETGERRARGPFEGAVDSFYASPVAGDGKVYFPSRTGAAVVLPSGGSLEPISVSELDDTVTATPALVDGTIYVRTAEFLLAFDLAPTVAAGE